MKTIQISIDVPADLLLALNESEEELKNHFQVTIAVNLFKEGKLTIGKARQLSGLSRFEFEKELVKQNVSPSGPGLNQVLKDVEKLSNL